MKREDYRKAIDDIPFSADFQERTAELLRQRARELEKEKNVMTLGKTKKLAMLLAAAVALLAVSVSAAMLWLSPAEVAKHHNQPLLAAAFESEDAILLNETIQSGDFSVTLLGLTSGAHLTTWESGADTSHTYAVLALHRLDGAPLDTQSFDFIAYTMTPLVAGYAPTAVNNWTLSAFATGFAHDGVYYYLLDTQDLGIFADHTVYMAFYEGGAPSNSIFTVAEDGSISFAEDFEPVHALFTLPLDPSLANPAAADAFVEGTGLNHWSNDRGPDLEYSEGTFIISEDGAPSDVMSSYHTAGEGASIFTPEEYADYMAGEKARLQQDLAKGVISQENYDAEIQEMEDLLESLRNGTQVAALSDQGEVFTIPIPDSHQAVQDGGAITLQPAAH